MLVGAGLLVVVIAVVSQAGPKLTEIAINHGLTRGHHDLGVVAVVAGLYVVAVGMTAFSQRLQVAAYRPTGGGGHERPAGQGVRPPPAFVARLLHRGWITIFSYHYIF